MKVVDGDGHVMEETAKLAKFLPDPFKHLTDRQRIFPPLDHFHAFIGETPPGSFREVRREGWLEFLEDVGIDTTVMYTTQGLALGKVFHRDWAIALCKAYNDYVHEEYLVHSPRFQAMALIPLQEPEAAVDELHRAVEELGFCGAMLPSTCLKEQLGAKEYWPVYAAADKLRCALGVHGGAHEGMGFDSMNVYTPVPAIGHPHGLLFQFGGMLFNGIWDRYPNARYGYMEGGVAWALTAYERFERSHKTHIQFNPRGELYPAADASVEEYIKRHIREGRLFIGCEGDEPSITHAIKLLGADAFVFSSDFPHEVNNDICRHEIEEFQENPDLTQAEKEAVMHGNAERLYGLKVPAAV